MNSLMCFWVTLRRPHHLFGSLSSIASQLPKMVMPKMSSSLRRKSKLVFFSFYFLLLAVVHPVECVSCGRTRFSGLRYQCTKCPSAWSHQCQECFWRGLSFSDSHHADHDIREHHTPVGFLCRLDNDGLFANRFYIMPMK